MDIYVATAVDYGDTADGKARTVGCFQSRTGAESAVKEDMKKYLSDNGMDENSIGYNPYRMSITPEDGNGCEWNIEKAKVEP